MPVFLSGPQGLALLDLEIERTTCLLADLRMLREHGVPPDGVLDRAPVLHDWRAGLRLIPCLYGHPSGHPIVSSRGESVTSPLRVAAPSLGFARTENRFYRLGRPDGAPCDA